MKFWWKFHNEICQESFENFHRDSGEKSRCVCSYFTKWNWAIADICSKDIITAGLILSNFVSEESKRPYFECVCDTILVMFTPENINFRLFKVPGPRMRIAFGQCKVTSRYIYNPCRGAVIDIEYNKRLDRQRPCLEGDFNGGSNNLVQSISLTPVINSTCSALRCLAIISSLV